MVSPGKALHHAGVRRGVPILSAQPSVILSGEALQLPRSAGVRPDISEVGEPAFQLP
jgi:hypothetical protein